MVYVNVHGDSIEMGEIPLPFGSAGVPNGAKQSHPRIHPVRPLAHAARQHFARLYCGAAQCYTIQPDGGSQNRIEILDRRKKKDKKKSAYSLGDGSARLLQARFEFSHPRPLIVRKRLNFFFFLLFLFNSARPAVGLTFLEDPPGHGQRVSF